VPGAAGDDAGAGAGFGPAPQAPQDLPGQIGLDEPPIGRLVDGVEHFTAPSFDAGQGLVPGRQYSARGQDVPQVIRGPPVRVDIQRLVSECGAAAATSARIIAALPVRSQFRAEQGFRAAAMAWTTTVSPGTVSVPASRSQALLCRLQRAHRPFSNSLSATPQSAHRWVSGRPAQSAHMIALGPGGAISRRC
jgi:hypothetical protein